MSDTLAGVKYSSEYYDFAWHIFISHIESQSSKSDSFSFLYFTVYTLTTDKYLK